LEQPHPPDSNSWHYSTISVRRYKEKSPYGRLTSGAYLLQT
jgi:hypothetical protein